jgi:hypothetical protein
LDEIWSASKVPSGGFGQLSVHLAVDTPVAEIKEKVVAWMQAQNHVPSFWQDAVVTVSSVGSALLHALFYMPEEAQREFIEAVCSMPGRNEAALRYTVSGLQGNEALESLEKMLDSEGLKPSSFTLSTDHLGERIFAQLTRGKPAKLLA